MKAEIKLYLCLGVLILFTLLFRVFSTENDSGALISSVDEFCNFNQLMVDLNCEVFFVEGENNRMVFEGPENVIKNLETIHDEGRILIKGKSSKILSGVINFFKFRDSDITIYISINDLREFEIIPVEDLANIKYASEKIIGVSLKDGESVLLESKNSKLSCI